MDINFIKFKEIQNFSPQVKPIHKPLSRYINITLTLYSNLVHVHVHVHVHLHLH